MNKKILTATMVVSLGMIGIGSYAGDVNVFNQAEGNICLLTGMPPAEVQYQKIKQVNADAIIGYNGSQRFGGWPW